MIMQKKYNPTIPKPKMKSKTLSATKKLTQKNIGLYENIKAKIKDFTKKFKLDVVNLSNNALFEDTDIKEVFKLMKTLATKTLILQNCRIDDDTAGSIIKELRRNTTLKELDLTNNINLHGRSIATIVEGFSGKYGQLINTTLTRLKLSSDGLAKQKIAKQKDKNGTIVKQVHEAALTRIIQSALYISEHRNTTNKLHIEIQTTHSVSMLDLKHALRNFPYTTQRESSNVVVWNVTYTGEVFRLKSTFTKSAQDT